LENLTFHTTPKIPKIINTLSNIKIIEFKTFSVRLLLINSIINFISNSTYIGINALKNKNKFFILKLLV